MSLNKLTTTNIRSNFNIGAGNIKCNELFTKNFKYNVYNKTSFTPTIYITNENIVPANIVSNNCNFYTSGSHLLLYGNIQFVYLGSTISPPDIYLTIPSDFELKIGSDLVSNNGSLIGLILNQYQKDYSALYDSSISLSPLNSIPCLKLNFVDEQNGADFSSSIYYLTFECTFKLV